MDCWTFMCTVCNVCRSDGGDQLVKVNRVEQTNKSVRLTEVVRALPVPTILHAPRVTAPLRDVWSARPGDGKDRMLHDEAFRSFSSMYVLGLCNRRRCLGVCWGRESSRELKVLASCGHPLYRRAARAPGRLLLPYWPFIALAFWGLSRFIAPLPARQYFHGFHARAR